MTYVVANPTVLIRLDLSIAVRIGNKKQNVSIYIQRRSGNATVGAQLPEELVSESD